MKRLILFFCCCVLTISTAMSQDLIVNENGDSIVCRIKKMDERFIYFSYLENEAKVNTTIDKRTITSFVKNFYSFEERDVSYIPKRDFSSFTFAANIGYGYRLGRIIDGIDANTRDHLVKLKSGFAFELQPTFYFSENSGLGLHICGFRTSATSSSSGGEMTDKIRITYIGPSWDYKVPTLNGKCVIKSNFGLGYMGYQDKANLNGPIKITGSSIGMLAFVGYDFLNENQTAAFSLGLRAILGSLNHIKISQGSSSFQSQKLEELENISHIDLVFGFRLYN